jgi:hypothetical protein
MLAQYRKTRVRLSGFEEEFFSGNTSAVFASLDPNRHEQGNEIGIIDFLQHNGKFKDQHGRRQGTTGKPDDPLTISESLSEYEITYSFSSAIRKNKFVTAEGKLSTYGSAISFRMLYEYLSQVWNGGHYFIDDYFAQFESRPVYEEFVSTLSTLKNKSVMQAQKRWEEMWAENAKAPKLRDKQGKFSSASKMSHADWGRQYERLAGEFGEWADFSVFSEAAFKGRVKELGAKIRQDIKLCLYVGLMPLHRSQDVARQTAFTRLRFPSFTNKTQVFHASGQLIDNIRIYIALDRGVA